jgi:hypothetical protein
VTITLLALETAIPGRGKYLWAVDVREYIPEALCSGTSKIGIMGGLSVAVWKAESSRLKCGILVDVVVVVAYHCIT